MTKMLAAFDFDHTIVDDNSDVVVRNLLKAEAPPFNNGKGWTSYMQEIFTLLAAEGIGEEDIRNVVVTMREVNGFAELLTFLNQKDIEVIIISDSNEYFINQWLVAKGYDGKIKKVFSNPAEFENGELRIRKYHIQDWCKLSTENLCKGFILENYIKEREAEGVRFDKVLYIGDGTNDHCPTLKLSSDDVTFPRKGYALMQKLDQLKEKSGIKSRIHPWSSHKDILTYVEANIIH